MSKIYLFFTAILLTNIVSAQAPQKMSYQAVVRNEANALVINQQVGIQISLMQGSVSGDVVFVETHTPSTNENGLFSIEIGSGTLFSGSMTTIDWSKGPYFIGTETDPTGGTNYTISGTSELLSVPYALHAQTAESITGEITVTETDPLFSVSVASSITATDTAKWNRPIPETGAQLDSTGIAKMGYVAGPRADLTKLAPLASPTFTGTVSGIDKAMVGLTNVDNSSDANKPVSTATQTALDLKESAANKSTDGTLATNSDNLFPTEKAVKTYVDSIAASGGTDASATAAGKIQLAGDLGGTATAPTVPGLALKAPLADPTFTGTVSGIDKTMVGLTNVDNTSDANKPVSTATQKVLDLKESAANKSTDGTLAKNSDDLFPTEKAVKTYVDGITASGVADASIETMGKIQLAGDLGGTAKAPTVPGLVLKAPLKDPIFTGRVKGIDKTMVGLSNVDNISDANKKVSIATQTALDLKASLNGYTEGDILYAGSDGKLTSLSAGSAGQVIAMNADSRKKTPEWIPAGVAKDGYKAGDFLYADDTKDNKLIVLSAGRTGQVLTMKDEKTPEWKAVDMSGNVAKGGYRVGDILYSGSDGKLTELKKGTAGQALLMNKDATTPEWGSAGVAKDGYEVGDILYAGERGITALSKGTAGQALVMNSDGKAPEWKSGGIAKDGYKAGDFLYADDTRDNKLIALSAGKGGQVLTMKDGTTPEWKDAIKDEIKDKITTIAPSQNAVFDGLALKAPVASPTFTGVPAAPTASDATTNTTQIATTAFVQSVSGGKVADEIKDKITAVAPSQNAVFDGLALKAPLASPTFTGVPAAPTAASGTNTTQIATTAFVQSAAPAKGGYREGAFLYAGADGVLNSLNGGTAGQALVMNSSGKAPEWKAAAGGVAKDGYKAGDFLYADDTRDKKLIALPAGRAGTVLTMNSDGKAPEWKAPVDMSGYIAKTGYVAGDLLYRGEREIIALSKGTAGQVLMMSDRTSAPTWGSLPTSVAEGGYREGAFLYAGSDGKLTSLNGGTAGQALVMNSSGKAPEWSSAIKTYSIGDFVHGGIVFWVDETGQHGLVCAKKDQSASMRWFGGTNGNTRAKGDGVYAGKANTTIIIAATVSIGDDNATYAARACNELQLEEGRVPKYGDWYLPSNHELNLMFLKKAEINTTAGRQSGSSLSSAYWSSTEIDNDGAYKVNMSDGNGTEASKGSTSNVRAVRTF